MLKNNKLLIIVAAMTGLFCSAVKADNVWPVVGKAKLEVLWFDIYTATLATPSGRFDQQSPFRLSLTYLRDFTKEQLIDETFKQLNTQISQSERAQWRQQLESMWLDVNKGDTFTFVADEQQLSHFYINEQYLGHVASAQFANAFADIWLSSKSEYPELAAKLKGITR